MTIIDCISDLHGHFPKLDGGDLLIVAGDLTAKDTYRECHDFGVWLANQEYRKKIVIAGNHDSKLFDKDVIKQFISVNEDGSEFPYATYLCDSGTEFTYYPKLEDAKDGETLERKTYKIWGSPWTLKFPGQNPKAMAFTCDTEEQLYEKFVQIPENIDILITHSPPFGMLDKSVHGNYCGSKSLDKILLKLNLKAHIFGHIHENYGQCHQGYLNDDTPLGHLSINASHVNERYEPINKPVRVIL